MLTKKQVKEIKEHLEKAQNPLFFFDNDQDGLCSFLLLQRYIGRGKGVPIRSFPGLNGEYFRKVHELKADYIFILDKPVVEKDFFEEVEKINIPVVWIDHHLIEKALIPSFVYYYNPLFNKKKSNEPVTALCYQITKRKEDMWIAVVGCISDRYIPKFYEKFEKEYPELTTRGRRIFDLFYKSQIGRIARIFGAGLKDTTTNVVNMLRFLVKTKSPYDVLEENSKNHTMHHRFKQIDSKYQKFLLKALSLGKKSDKLLFFQYSGDLSISSELANEINYMFPEKMVVVVYIKDARANISARGKNARKIFLEAIKGLEEATGGGHEFAVGGRIKTSDIEKFHENLEKIITG
ncbi:MAG: DHH family phosphoesterase [Nanoarchaeota archaeon]|nr:DHH family phosphoesterase [Nanoarchaeota archaeon]